MSDEYGPHGERPGDTWAAPTDPQEDLPKTLTAELWGQQLTIDLDPQSVEAHNTGHDPLQLPTTLAEAVDVTRQARKAVQTLAATLHQLMQDFEAAHASVFEALAEARDRQARLEQRTRQLGLGAWMIDRAQEPRPSKTIYPGVQIRERITLVYDRAEALVGAQAGNRLAVQPEQLNVEVFEALAKKFPGQVPFVQQVVTYQVALSREL